MRQLIMVALVVALGALWVGYEYQPVPSVNPNNGPVNIYTPGQASSSLQLDPSVTQVETTMQETTSEETNVESQPVTPIAWWVTVPYDNGVPEIINHSGGIVASARAWAVRRALPVALSDHIDHVYRLCHEVYWLTNYSNVSDQDDPRVISLVDRAVVLNNCGVNLRQLIAEAYQEGDLTGSTMADEFAASWKTLEEYLKGLDLAIQARGGASTHDPDPSELLGFEGPSQRS